MKKTIKSVFICMAFSGTCVYAGGDNQVSMTDIKEALYNLVIASDKSNKVIDLLDERITKLEPLSPVVEKNQRNISAIVARINELGIPSTVEQSNEVNSEISRFVEYNKHLIFSSGQGNR